MEAIKLSNYQSIKYTKQTDTLNFNCSNTIINNLTVSTLSLNSNMDNLYKVALLFNKQPYNVNGGISNTGYNLRTINDIEYNNIAGVSLNSNTNTFTLPAGKYNIYIGASVYTLGQHLIKLHNLTTNVSHYGTAGFGSSSSISVLSHYHDILTLNQSCDFQVYHFIKNKSGKDNDFGLQHGITAETDPNYQNIPNIYLQVKIQKI